MSTIQEQKLKVETEIKKLEEMGGSLTGRAKRFRDTAFTRFPIIFSLLTTFGLVATLYGFEKFIDGIDFFAENPEMILLAGLLTLTITGALYRKLA